jgi:hypothetical protein
MKKEKKTQMGLRVVLVLASVLLLPIATAQDPPVDDREECLAYAYTSSENHLFLLGENVSMFGERLVIVHDCEEVEVFIDGVFQAGSSSNFALIVEPGTHNISIEGSGFNDSFSNVVFFPDRLEWEYDFQLIQESKPQFIEINLAQLQTNWAVGIGIVVVWVLTTYVYWSLISSYVDRNFIEEVSQ